MSDLKICMIGAGSGFVISIARELVVSPVFQGCEFTMMDINPQRLKIAEREVKKILDKHRSNINVRSTTHLAKALDGAHYVIASCEIKRWAFWLKDLKIPERHHVYQMQSENGGPAGQIHALRNIGIFTEITDAMSKYCPAAWLMNFTNPMSFLCTYLNKYTRIKTLGFCHQVHGSFGVIAEQLGMEPGELEVVSGGINHFNWLFDVRKRGTGKSCLPEFYRKVKQSPYWRKKFPKTPRQNLRWKYSTPSRLSRGL